MEFKKKLSGLDVKIKKPILGRIWQHLSVDPITQSTFFAILMASQDLEATK